MQSLFNRNNVFQTIRVRLENAAALDGLRSYVENDPRLKLDVKSEAAYIADQASRTSDLIHKLGWPLAIAMAFGALAGALNESLVLAALGGVIGAAATLLIFDGFIASTLGGSFTQVIFSFQLSPGLVAEGVILALLVGLIGGVFPAFRAARMPIVANLYS